MKFFFLSLLQGPFVPTVLRAVHFCFLFSFPVFCFISIHKHVFSTFWELVMVCFKFVCEASTWRGIISACELYRVHRSHWHHVFILSLFSRLEILYIFISEVNSLSNKTCMPFLINCVYFYVSWEFFSFFKNVFYNFLLVFSLLAVVSLISMSVSEIYLFMMENILVFL